MSERKPLIAISTSFDLREDEYLIPGRLLCFVDPDYAGAVEKAGGAPVLVPYLESLAAVDAVLGRVSGLVMTGGGRTYSLKSKGRLTLREQNPARYEFDCYLVRSALSLGLPLVGICRGCQMIAEVTGGEVAWIESGLDHQQEGKLPSQSPSHPVYTEPGSLLARIVGETRIHTNSFHRQAVTRVGTGYRVAARARDGVTEAFEKENGSFVLGLQFHPEKMPGEQFSQSIWRAFVNAAISYCPKAE
jgi:putative glutamine amidotransferase